VQSVVNSPRLLDRVKQTLRARHYSRRTGGAYVVWIRRFIAPENSSRNSRSECPQFGDFAIELAPNSLVLAVRARRPERLPVVLTRQEVRATLDRMEGTPRLVGGLLYGAGLRLMECLTLRVKRTWSFPEMKFSYVTGRARRTGDDASRSSKGFADRTSWPGP